MNRARRFYLAILVSIIMCCSDAALGQSKPTIKITILEPTTEAELNGTVKVRVKVALVEGQDVLPRDPNVRWRVDEAGKVRAEGDEFLPWRLERVEGERLWLKRTRRTGWAKKTDLISTHDALTYFTHVIRTEPSSWAFVMRGAARRALSPYRLADLDSAIEDFSEAIRLDPDNALAYFNRAVAWQGRSDQAQGDGVLDKAIADYTMAIRLKPESFSAYQSRGHVRWLQGDKADYKEDRKKASEYFRKAIDDYSEAIRLNPKDFNLYGSRARVWYRLEDYRRAVDDVTKVIELAPKPTPFSYLSRAQAWEKIGDFERALKDHNEAVKLMPGGPGAFFRVCRGHVWRKLGDEDKALADYNAALRDLPGLPEAYLGRASVWEDQGDFDKAITEYDGVIRRNPNNAEAYYGRADAWLNGKHNYKNAIDDLTELVRIRPRKAKAHNMLAQVLTNCPEDEYRDTTRAIMLATKACELTRWENAAYISTLSAAYEESGDSEKAEYYRKMVHRQHNPMNGAEEEPQRINDGQRN